MIGHRLLHDRCGTPIVEFALVLPVMLVLMIGLGELAYQEFVQSVLTGAVQKAARNQGIEANANSTDVIDGQVEAAVRSVLRNPTFNSRSARRVNYDNYTATAGEPFTDKADSSGNFDGICDKGENYVDLNGNSHWDQDLGTAGQGGASDLVKYTVTVTYRRLFPVGLLKWGNTVTLTASTMFRNQPYAVQSMNNGTLTGTCS